jgi:hypothetical protein
MRFMTPRVVAVRFGLNTARALLYPYGLLHQ